MKTTTLLASIAASSLVLAQPAAAATRSSESVPASGIFAVDGQRVGAAVGESEEQRRRGLWLIFATLGLAALLIILLDGGSKSPG